MNIPVICKKVSLQEARLYGPDLGYTRGDDPREANKEMVEDKKRAPHSEQQSGLERPISGLVTNDSHLPPRVTDLCMFRIYFTRSNLNETNKDLSQKCSSKGIPRYARNDIYLHYDA